MTLHKISAGDGYTYLTRQVAVGDNTDLSRDSIAAYYGNRGESPGRWQGRLAHAIGVDGAVSEAQMLALFGEGRHPDATGLEEAAVAAGLTPAAAAEATRLGRPFPVYDISSQYAHRPVDTLDPVEVLKACHTYEQLASDSPGWSASTARRLTDAIARAAARRISGYDAAPVMWSRLRGRAIGLTRRWRPVDGPAVMWLDPTAFAAHWADAAQVLITLEALPDLPAGLGTRPHVFALTDAWPSPSQWQRLKTSPATALVTCPGLGWLRQLLARRVTL